jgi:hypothetical protein
MRKTIAVFSPLSCLWPATGKTSETYPNAYADTYPYSDAYADTDTHTYSQSDTHTQSNPKRNSCADSTYQHRF